MKIGILCGTFDPVHSGHIEFALAAIKKAGLKEVYFLPERNPRQKKGVTPYKIRVEMLKLALDGEDKLKLLQLRETAFSVDSTGKKLKRKFTNDNLVFLFGSDVAVEVPNWPNAKKLSEIIVAFRDQNAVKQVADNLSSLGLSVSLMESPMKNVSSRGVRAGRYEFLPKPVAIYIKQNKIYNNEK